MQNYLKYGFRQNFDSSLLDDIGTLAIIVKAGQKTTPLAKEPVFIMSGLLIWE